MKLIITEDYNEMSKKAANIIAEQINEKPNTILGLATGSTPLGMYKELIGLYEEKKIDYKETMTFNLDEYHGLSEENNQSYHYYMMENFFKHINIDFENINIPDGKAIDINKSSREYESRIQKSGGIDIQILGIGRNGHIGFNEPGEKFEWTTHLVELDNDTIEANSRFFSNPDEVPKKAVSMGIKTIMNAKKIILLASGGDKADAIFKSVNGEITPEVPASILQLHPDVTLVIDREAAARL